MNTWIHTLLFIFSLLVVGRNIFLILTKLFSTEPSRYKLNYKELILLGITISYAITYIIH
jgi:hypothetical protein